MKLVLVSLVSIFISSTAFSHGEDKPGPHGGHIKMPSNFHTEVVGDKDGSFHIFLLDMQFENPTVKDSEIKAHVLNGKKKTKLNCSVMGSNHFHCKSSKAIKTGSLVLKAKREGSWAGTDAVYQLPLKNFEKQPEKSIEKSTDHSHHH